MPNATITTLMALLQTLGIQPTLLKGSDLPAGKGQPFGLLVGKDGKAVTKVEDAIGIVHAQRFVVTRGNGAGDWFRRADKDQVATTDSKVLVILPGAIKANAKSFPRSIAKVLRCEHRHDQELTGWDWIEADGFGPVWADLKPKPSTGRTCSACDTACRGRTALGRNTTWTVAHNHNELATCGEAHKAWKGRLSAKAIAEAEAKAKAEAEAKAKAAAKAAKAKATRERNKAKKAAEAAEAESA